MVIADIQDERGEQLAHELRAQARFIHTDVTQEDAVKGAIQLALDTFGRFDCIFNNAGFRARAAPSS